MMNLKKQIANLLWILLLVCILSLAASAVYFHRIWYRASHVATETHNTPLSNHGKVVYVTEDEFYRYAVLFRIGVGGGLSLMALAFLLQFAGVQVASKPSEEEIKAIENVLRRVGLEEYSGNIREQIERQSKSGIK